MKQLFSAFLTGVLVVVATLPQAEAALPGVGGTVYQPAYDYLQARGTVEQGRPYDSLNRAEALKVILESRTDLRDRAAWHRGHMLPMSLFYDVIQTEWYAPYVETAFESGIVTGYPDGSFKPGRFLSVEEAITLMVRTLDDGTATSYQTSSYIQNRPNEWFSPHISRAIERNLIMHQGQLRLGAPITRGQFFDILYRFLVISESNQATYTGPEPTGGATTSGISINTGTTYQPTPPTGGFGINAGGSQGGGTVTTGAAQPNHPYASSKPFAMFAPDVNIHDLTIIHPSDPFSSQGVLAPLQQGVGHLFSYPGAGGKIMIYGHSSSYPWDVSQYTKVFRQINKLQPGHKIYVTYEKMLYVYQVTFEEAIPAADTSRFNDNGQGEELILYTCWPPDSIEQRYLVHAVPVETIPLQ